MVRVEISACMRPQNSVIFWEINHDILWLNVVNLEPETSPSFDQKYPSICCSTLYHILGIEFWCQAWIWSPNLCCCLCRNLRHLSWNRPWHYDAKFLCIWSSNLRHCLYRNLRHLLRTNDYNLWSNFRAFGARISAVVRAEISTINLSIVEKLADRWVKWKIL